MTPLTQADGPALTRPQRRLLCRIFNGLAVPIVADGRSFLTYKDASRYLLSLSPEARAAVYAELKSKAPAGSHKRETSAEGPGI
jgi:hypothetical protein